MQPMAEWFANDPAWATRYPNVTPNPGYDSIGWYATYDHKGRACTNLLNGLGTSGAPSTLGAFWNGYRP